MIAGRSPFQSEPPATLQSSQPGQPVAVPVTIHAGTAAILEPIL